jgi:PAS domain S-box-containing protein
MSLVVSLPIDERSDRAPTIARRLIVLVVAAVVPVLAFSAFLVARYSDNARAGYEAQMVATARALSIAVDREIASQEAELTALSNASELARGDWPGFYQRCQLVVGSSGRVVVLVDLEGHEIFNTALPLGTQREAAGMQPFRQAVKTGAPAVTNLILAPGLSRYGIGVEVPVFQDGQVAYVLVMGFGPERISNILVEQRLAPGWVASVFDRKGVILARSRNADRLIGQQANAPAAPAGGFPREGIIDAVTEEGVQAKAAFVRSDDSGWVVALGVDRRLLDEPVRRSLFAIGGGGVALLAVALMVAYAYSRRIARPIASLANMAATVGRGEIPRRESLGIKEADAVSEELHDAAVLLHERILEREALLASLEDRVESRTRELTESEAKYRLLADNITDMVVRADMEKVTYVSPSSVALSGYTPDELIQGAGNHLVHPDDFPDVVRALRGLTAGAPDVVRSYRLIRKDGSHVWVEGSFRHLFDARAGQSMGYVATVRDMTRHHRAEERAHRAALEAEAANRAKSQFLASMSHELRTPLNAVIGFADFLLFDERQPLTENQRQSVGFILRAGRQLLELIEERARSVEDRERQAQYLHRVCGHDRALEGSGGHAPPDRQAEGHHALGRFRFRRRP